MKEFLTVVLLSGLLLAASSCGDGECGLTAIAVLPSTATADHNALAPANQVQFKAIDSSPAQSGCVRTACFECPLGNVQWSVSDPASVSIASTGVATCTGASNGPVTVTAVFNRTSGKALSATASLTCQ